MAKQNILVGTVANDKTGDTLRNAFVKANANFTELYTLTGGSAADLRELAQDYAAPLFNHASHTNITVTYDDANNKILLTGVASAVWPVANTAGASGPTKIAIGVNAGLTSQAAGAVAIGNIAGVTNQGQVAVAIGMNAGNQNQGGWATAVGSAAGYNAQGTYGVAVGYLSGYTGQGSYAVAVGAGSANGSQGANAVAVGYQAGNQNQGAQSIAIGANAGATSQAANTIILNATGSAVNGVAAQTDSFYVSPIRSATATSDVLYYNTTTKEITYAAAGSVSSLVNGVHTLSLGSTGNTTFPTGLVLGAPRGPNTVNFTCSVDKEFQIETGTASAGRLWQFGTTGTTTFPSGLTLHRLSSSYSNITADLNKILQVATQTSGGRKEWSFGTDGTTTFPTNISINYSGGNVQFPRIIADSGKAFSVQGQGASGSAALAWTVDPDAAGQYAQIGVTKNGGDNLAKVILTAQSNSGSAETAKTWKFNETGKLTLPTGGFIEDSASYIKLTPAGGSNAYQALLIYPTAGDGNHIHLAAPTGGTTELYLGNDIHYVKLVNGGNVEVRANNGVNDTAWTFGTDGSLALPNLAVIGQAADIEITAASTAYTNSLTTWESVRASYQAQATSLGVTSAGWPFIAWNATGPTAAGLIAQLLTAYQIQQGAPTSPPTALIFVPPITTSAYNELRAALILVRDSYTTWQALLTSVEITAGSESITLLANGKLQVPNIIQTDPEEDLVIRTRYAVATSPPGIGTYANKDFVFSTNGSITFSRLDGLTVLATVQGDSSGNLNLTAGNYVNIESNSYAAITLAKYTANTSVDIGNVTSPARMFGDLQIMTGRHITTNSSSINLINTSATTVNFAGAATTALNIGASGAPITGFAATATTSSTASSLGYLGLPQSATTTTATLAIGDAGKHIYVKIAGQTITIPDNSVVPYPIGTTITFIAGGLATTVTIANNDTMYLAGASGASGTRTLAAYGMATAVKVATYTWFINGSGLT